MGDLSLYSMVQAMYNNSGVATNAALIWENGDPTSAIAAQTIYLDLTFYTHVIIEMKYYLTTETSDYSIKNVPTDEDTETTGYAIAGITTTGLSSVMRYVVVSQSAIKFGNGIEVNSSGTAHSDNSYGIPLCIWGVYDMTLQDS